MVFLCGALNDPTLHICGVCFGLNVAHGTNNIILINISTAHTPRPSLTSNHIHIYTNCMNMNTEVKFFLFSFNIWSSYFCVSSIDIPDFASMLWVFFFACCFMCLHRKIHIWGTKIFHEHFDAIGLFNVFSQQVAAFFSISLFIYEFSHIWEMLLISIDNAFEVKLCVYVHIRIHTHPTNTQKYQPGKLKIFVNLSLH